jgi:hypothetical protein
VCSSDLEDLPVPGRPPGEHHDLVPVAPQHPPQRGTHLPGPARNHDLHQCTLTGLEYPQIS